MKSKLAVSATFFASIMTIGCTTGNTKPQQTFEQEMNAKYAPEIAKARDNGAKILISDFGTPKPNSAGGVSVSGAYFPIADENNPIKYIIIDAVPFNAVADQVESSIGGKSRVSLKITGPEYGNEYTRMRFANAWYNPTIDCARIASVKVEMMDGSEHEYSGDLSEIVTQRFAGLKPCGGAPRYQAMDN